MTFEEQFILTLHVEFEERDPHMYKKILAHMESIDIPGVSFQQVRTTHIPDPYDLPDPDDPPEGWE